MLELGTSRKSQKVNLSDYNFQQDIDNRIRINDFSLFEHEVLQEILFSPLRFPMKKLCRSLDCKEEDVANFLEKLKSSGLLTVDQDMVAVDKEMRKYFEFQMHRFDPDFKPDMEFAQGILRKVPIHLLTSWYAVPRTSNNIFESIVEKYLATPHIFQRYIAEIPYPNKAVHGIVLDLFQAPDYKIASSDLIAKYNLNRRTFEEAMLWLEFHFIACLTYEKQEDHWLEWVSPFHEWHQYLRFLKATQPSAIPSSKIARKRESDFAFVEDLAEILLFAKKNEVVCASLDALVRQLQSANLQCAKLGKGYVKQLIEKLLLVQLASSVKGRLVVQETASAWLKMSLQNRALFLYRHPMNRPLSLEGDEICIPSNAKEEDKSLRSAEKAIKRVLHGEWVFFDDFVKGVTVCLDGDSEVALKRVGKQWQYALPSLNEKERALLRQTVCEWLFEAGMTAIGVCQGKECFSVTAFGRSLFEE